MRNELAIPKNVGEVMAPIIIGLFVVFFVALAVMNLCSDARGIGLIGSIVWLVLVLAVLFGACKEAGSARQFLINRVGDVVGRRFVEVSAGEFKRLEFGFKVFGRRFIQRSILFERIESVEWNTGQASYYAKRDMNDWQVWLWYDHLDPTKSEKFRQWHRKADQDLCAVGPSGRKTSTERLGFSFVEFLRRSGADLVQRGSEPCFIRRTHEQDTDVPTFTET